MLKIVNLVKTYKTKKSDTVYALNDVSIDFPESGLVFLLGKSGSGKSTLLNAIGGLDVFDSGEIIIKGKSSKDFSQSDFDSYRNTFIGFIFQEYNILENFTVAKNLELALELQGKKPKKQEVNALLEQVDMLQYAHRKPNQLSGGQKQRVAIARALIKNPEIIMADEPTGALDSNTGKQVMDTLKKLSKEKLVIIVSHDREFAEIYGDRIIELKDGKIISDLTKKEIQARETESGIKFLSDDLVYIKKGQKISAMEATKMAKMILEKTAENDMFLSFDCDANNKLRDGAKINENGNKESFLATQDSDIASKQYNGKDLKLIKSHLKFSDSFKMGASSLRHKVGKLIFTILLSLFAFTVFGLIDTFSTWNRATSVWDGIQYDNVNYIAMKKYKKMDGYSKDVGTTEADLEMLSKKFPEIDFIPIAGGSSYGYVSGNNISIVSGGYTLKTAVNPVNCSYYLGAVCFDNEKLEKFGLTIEGRLPENENEIAISKHLWETLQHNCESLHNWSGLQINVRYGNQTIVGIVDDKMNFGKYTTLSDGDFSSSQSYSLMMEITTKMQGGFSNMVFLNEDNIKELEKKASMDDVYMYLNSSRVPYSAYRPLTFDDITSYGTTQQTVEQVFYYYKGARRNIIVGDADAEFTVNALKPLGAKEIIIPHRYVDGTVSQPEMLINSGALRFKMCEDYDGEKVLETYTVVGTSEDDKIYMSNQDCENFTKVYAPKCQSFMAVLSKTDKDKEFINYCENYNSNNIRFSVQNSATSIFDTFEDVITIISSIFFYVAIVFAVFAAFLLMSFISNSVNSKKREIGVLRALGARGSDVYGIFFNESSIIAFINFTLSALATFIACTVINKVIINKIGATVILLSFSLRQVLLILAVSWGSAIIASFIPSIKISKKHPIDAINNR